MTCTTGVTHRQRIIVQYEIEEVDDMDTLEEIADAAQTDDDVVSDAASQRFSTLQEESIRATSVRAGIDSRNTGSFHTARPSLSLDFAALLPDSGNPAAVAVTNDHGPDPRPDRMTASQQAQPVIQQLKYGSPGNHNS
jgi:hypothetical protein